MKKLFSILVLTLMIVATGCKKDEGNNTSDPTDYSKAAHWLSLPAAVKEADVFYLYGELHNSRKIARTIVNARNNAPFGRIFPFIEVLKPYFGREKEKKDKKDC